MPYGILSHSAHTTHGAGGGVARLPRWGGAEAPVAEGFQPEANVLRYVRKYTPKKSV